jgi:hypothetical protein
MLPRLWKNKFHFFVHKCCFSAKSPDRDVEIVRYASFNFCPGAHFLFPASYFLCSQDTALRDITELLERGILKKSAATSVGGGLI